MSKKFLFLISFVLVLSVASTSYSADPCVIGNWEDVNDGWRIDPCAPPGTAMTYSTTGVTLDTKSLKVDVNDHNGWNAAIYIPLEANDVNLVDEFFDNDFFSVDVTRLDNEWLPADDPNYNAGIHLIVNANSVPDGNVWFDLGARAWWSPGDGNNPRRAGWDYSATKADINEASVSYLQLILVTNYDPNFTTGGIYYLDNAKLSTFTGVIGNFENDMDGWDVADDVNITVDYNSTTGVTLDGNSLRIDSNNLYNLAIQFSLIDQGLVDKFRNNLKVSADVTRLASEWTTSGEGQWCEFFLVVQAGSANDPNWDLWGQLDTEADWAPGDGDEPKNFIYDYSTTLNQIDFDNLEYLNFIFSTNWGGYEPGGTYYLDKVQMFGGGPAYSPNPADGQRTVPIDANLSWTPGIYADKHDVYFSTDKNKVTDANRDVNFGVLVSMNQDPNTYDLDTLIYGKNYYWRIDEINDAGPDPCIWPGEVWSFTTMYLGGDYILGDWEDDMENWTVLKGTPSYSTTGATLNSKSLKIEIEDGWWWTLMLTCSDEQLEALKANNFFSLDVTWVTNDWTGEGTYAGVDTIAINADGIGWNQVDGPVDDTSNPGSPGDWNKTDFGDSDTRTITWDYSEVDVESIPEGGWCFFEFNTKHDFGEGGTFYFDNARLPDRGVARYPNPARGATDVPRNKALIWTPGDYAVTHDVYFDTNEAKVTDANRDVNLGVLVSQDQDPCSYAPGLLDSYTTYYWRIDEVSGTDFWKGNIWSFTTGNSLIVDDFDLYADTDALDDVWKKVGPSVIQLESTLVRSGKSMKLRYDHHSKPYYSEAYADVNDDDDWPGEIGSDWTAENVKALVLYFYGQSDNYASEQMYVKLADYDGNEGVVLYDGDMNDIKKEEWQEWNIALQGFVDNNNVNLANVSRITIGFGDGVAPGGDGDVYFDDIRLYPRRCRLSERDPNFTNVDYIEDCVVDYQEVALMAGSWLVEAATAGDANLVSHWKFDGDATDSSGNNNGTLYGNPQWVAGYVGSNSIDFDVFDANDYVDCGNDVSLDINDAITLSVWVKTDDSGNGEFNPYITKGDQTYGIKHDDSDNIQFVIYDEAFFTAIYPVDSSFNGVWHHLAGTYDGSQLKLYIDGVLRGSNIHTGSIATNTLHLDIGRNNEYTNRFYDGTIDDARIYDKALSQAEIAFLAGSDWRLDLYEDQKVNFKDFAVLADGWLEEQLWPLEP